MILYYLERKPIIITVPNFQVLSSLLETMWRNRYQSLATNPGIFRNIENTECFHSAVSY